MTYVRYATRARKHVIKLDDAHTNDLVDQDLVAVTILSKGTGTFSLKFIFPDGNELDLDNTELSDKDVWEWDVAELRLTNTAQAGATIKLLIDHQVGIKVAR